MLDATRRNVRPVWLATAAIFAALLGLWQLRANASNSVAFFFSSPSQVAAALRDGFQSGVAVSDLGASGSATMVGLGLGILAGCLAGFAAIAVPILRDPVRGVVAALAALPILAVAPMFLIWFGTGPALKIALGGVLSGLVIAARAMDSGAAVPPQVHELLRANDIAPSRQARKVIIPASLEWTLSSVPAAANAAFLGVFIGEFVAADAGIGYRILRAGALYQVDVVLAQTVLALLMLTAIQVAAWVLRDAVGAIARFAALDPIYRQ